MTLDLRNIKAIGAHAFPYLAEPNQHVTENCRNQMKKRIRNTKRLMPVRFLSPSFR